MDDPRDLALVEDTLERREVGDVSLLERHARQVAGRHDQRDPVRVVAEVVPDDVLTVVEQRLDRPRADTAERAGDEPPFRHQPSGASWYTVTPSV